MLETFDFCDTTQSTERRAVTSVAPQALTLMNGEFVTRQADRFAQRLEQQAGPDVDAQISLAFRLAVAREPVPSEVDALRQFLQREVGRQRQELAEEASDPGLLRHRALVQMCRAMLNLNEFVYPN
jgi:hypothetical protein